MYIPPKFRNAIMYRIGESAAQRGQWSLATKTAYLINKLDFAGDPGRTFRAVVWYRKDYGQTLFLDILHRVTSRLAMCRRVSQGIEQAKADATQHNATEKHRRGVVIARENESASLVMHRQK